MNIGVYKISNLVNNKFYIGSSIELKKRFQQHKSELRANKHHCNYLQKAWNKYGEKEFEFLVLEYCSDKNCIVLEQKYINDLKPHYNICPIAGSSKGRKLTKEHKEKLRLANLGKPHSEERIENIRIGRRKANTPEFREKQRINATGVKKTEKSRKKQSESLKKYLSNPEAYEKRKLQLLEASKKRKYHKTNE